MPSSQTQPEPAVPREGLRARKRRATENAIELAGVELALEHGLAAVTIAEICERAQISRSTFFNYMPSREAAIMGRPVDVLPHEIGFALLDSAAGDVPLGLLRVVVASIGHSGVNAPVAAARRRLAAEQPEAAKLQQATLADLRRALIALTLDWLNARPTQRMLQGSVQREVLLLVGIAGIVAEVLLDEWSQADGETQISEESLHATVSDLAALLRRTA
ncbi:hypothetical protein GCM10022381_06460 [Leifsonia kafniensis]|uniref:HTH tetR-type domain-containing protein n=1 Tax=Leifsonia kafniensis TaxID=475957 RepID=A0ABP7K6J5_9MICO